MEIIQCDTGKKDREIQQRLLPTPSPESRSEIKVQIEGQSQAHLSSSCQVVTLPAKNLSLFEF